MHFFLLDSFLYNGVICLDSISFNCIIKLICQHEMRPETTLKVVRVKDNDLINRIEKKTE